MFNNFFLVTVDEEQPEVNPAATETRADAETGNIFIYFLL